MGIDRNTKDGILVDNLGLINEKDDIAQINSGGKIRNLESDPQCNGDEYSEVDTVIQFCDKWSEETFGNENKFEKINNILLSDCIDNSNWNNKNENSPNFSEPQVNYTNNVLEFSDETLGKYNIFGCMYEGTDKVNLLDLVKDIEVMDEFNRITDFGNIYDFQVKKITYGAYKFSNVRICSNISKFLGYFSLDKMLNDEQIRQHNAEEFGHKYDGILVNEEYVEEGWIDIDYLVQLSLQDDYGYDSDNSLQINTKRFKDRKKALIYLILNYTCDIWSLNSKNKLVDFGIRIIDKTTSEVLDYSSFTNGTNNEVSYSGILQYFGDLANPEEVVEEDIEQPDHMEEPCDKVLTNKCNGRHFRISPISSLEESDEDSYFHEISPQFKINLLKEARESKLDILNTIDAVHWTTGIEPLEEYSINNKIEFDFIDDLVKEFGREPFLSTYLVEDRAFHNGGGDFFDGFCGSGVYHIVEPTTGILTSGNRQTTEKWNGTSWSILDRTAPEFSLGISGGTSSIACAGWGAKFNFTEIIPHWMVSPNDVVIDNNIYIYKEESGWQVSKLNTIVNKFACAGIIHAKEMEKTSFISIDDEEEVEKPEFEWDEPEEIVKPDVSERRKRKNTKVESIWGTWRKGARKSKTNLKRIGRKLKF